MFNPINKNASQCTLMQGQDLEKLKIKANKENRLEELKNDPVRFFQELASRYAFKDKTIYQMAKNCEEMERERQITWKKIEHSLSRTSKLYFNAK
jgi:hypothetical protein